MKCEMSFRDFDAMLKQAIQFSKSLYDKYLRSGGVNFLWKVYDLVK